MNPSPVSIPVSSPLILVIDDDRFMRVHLRQILEDEGYRVEEANDGQQGIEAYLRLRPDVVLLDALMPVMDGFHCCAKLKQLQEAQLESEPAPSDATDKGADRSLSATPVLMITGLEDEKSVDQAFEVGATDYITKPIHVAVLRRRVRRMIQQYELYRQVEETNQKLEEVNQILRRLALVDGLTHVANRRCFDETLTDEWQRLAREQAPLALILTDIDYFKKYNDTYGHLEGDKCLKQVAQTINSAVSRPADLVARYGGEEFAVILPNTSLAGASYIAEEIRMQVKSLELPHASSGVGDYVSLSLGVASLIPNPKAAPTTLITAADKALYLAKATGRDRACLFTP